MHPCTLSRHIEIPFLSAHLASTDTKQGSQDIEMTMIQGSEFHSVRFVDLYKFDSLRLAELVTLLLSSDRCTIMYARGTTRGAARRMPAFKDAEHKILLAIQSSNITLVMAPS